MTGPDDGARLWLTVLFAAWVMAFVFAFYAYAVTSTHPNSAPRTMAFLGWQGVAGIIAVGIFGISRQWPTGAAVRKLGAVPLILAALLALGILGMVFWTGAV